MRIDKKQKRIHPGRVTVLVLGGFRTSLSFLDARIVYKNVIKMIHFCFLS